MYLEHFGLTEAPFSTVPDPRFYYPSVKHREALACLVYAIQNHKGVALVTGDIGTGKTMLCQAVLNQIDGDTRVALLDYTLLAPDEFHQVVCESFDLSPEGSKFELRRRLGEYAEEQKAGGSDTVLIVDEAQNLSQEVLEELRNLSNLTTPGHMLLQIILLGQPEFRRRISAPSMEALDQRITLKFHLGPLSMDDTKAYIAHRLKKAGAKDDTIFDEEARDAVHQATGGVPRLINVLCDQAMLMAYSRDETTVTAEMVEETVEDREGFYCEDRSVARNVAPAVPAMPAEARPADSEEWKEYYDRFLQFQKDLESRLAEERQRADRLNERVQTLEEKIVKYSDKIEELQELKRNQEDAVAARDRQIEGLKQELGELNDAHRREQKLRKRLETLQEKIEAYLQRIAELQEQKHGKTDALAARDRDVAELKRRLAESVNEAGDEAGIHGQLEALREELDRDHSAREETRTHLLEAGERAYDAGRSEEAVAMLQAAVDLGLDSPFALYRLGSALFQIGQYESAIERYEDAISRLESADDPDRLLLLKACNNCGVALARLGHSEKALKMYRKALGLEEGYPSPYLNMGLLYRDKLDDEDAAIRAFRRYIEVNGRRSEEVAKAIGALESEQKTAQ